MSTISPSSLTNTRRPLGDVRSGLSLRPGPPIPNSSGIISFADPRPLTSIESYRSKIIGGRALGRRTLSNSHSGTHPPPSTPFLFMHFQEPIFYPLSFQTHPGMGGTPHNLQKLRSTITGVRNASPQSSAIRFWSVGTAIPAIASVIIREET